MSSLSRCKTTRRAPKALPAGALLRTMAIFLALLLFGLAHLHLRFSLNQMQSETGQVQAAVAALRSEVNALQGKTQALKRPQRLFDYARLELGMTPYATTERQTLAMPREIAMRYELARAARGAAGEAEADPKAVWLEKLSERLGLIGEAQARPTRAN